jgi:hypothetical protein
MYNHGFINSYAKIMGNKWSVLFSDSPVYVNRVSCKMFQMKPIRNVLEINITVYNMLLSIGLYPQPFTNVEFSSSTGWMNSAVTGQHWIYQANSFAYHQHQNNIKIHVLLTRHMAGETRPPNHIFISLYYTKNSVNFDTEQRCLLGCYAVCLLKEIHFNIPEDAILHSHRCENLKSYTILTLFITLISCHINVWGSGLLIAMKLGITTFLWHK